MARSVIDILEELEATSGSNAKKSILEVACNNELLRKVFIAAQNPYIVYFVSKFKVPTPCTKAICDDDTVLNAFLGLLLKLSSRELTGNVAKNAVVDFFKDLNAIQQKWCQRIIIRNLRCGVQESTVNKVWPGTINCFEVALAATLKSRFTPGIGIEILESVKYPVRVEPKLDGLRCIAIKKSTMVTFYTRNGNPIDTPGIAHIKAMLEVAPYDNVVLDGEMLANGNWNDSVSTIMKGRQSK